MIEQLARRLRYGKPILVVSGLPRSGTSMAMKMLEAGGMPILTDGIRAADDSNPKGYFEFERVKDLDKDDDKSWLNEARGKVVKIISFLLTSLPETYDYRVIFMHRNLHEVIQSQNKLLAARGEPTDTTGDDRMLELYGRHLEKITRFIAARRCFRTLEVHYRDAIERPVAEARRINAFLGRRLDVDRMAAVADRELYHNRA